MPYFQFPSTNWKFTEDFQLFNDILFEQWRVTFSPVIWWGGGTGGVKDL